MSDQLQMFRGGGVRRPNIITFGSPCQDFSLAGKRLGMDGQRSSLILHAIRLIQECRPDVFIWENVKGAFSSNSGADFWGIVQAFANIGGYRLEWQLLNTAWFLPQNRERIYLVGHLAERSECRVFPISESDCIRNGRNAASEEIHTDNRIAITQQARQYSSWCGDFIRQRARGNNKGGDHHICTSISSNSFEQNNHVSADNSIRRLTEIECERLQGYPDGWTEFGNYDGVIKRIPKTQRYKLLGNAVTKHVVEAIGIKLKMQFA